MPTALTYSRLHRQFLTQHNPEVLKQMREPERTSYLKNVGEQAMEMHDNLASRMQTNPNLPTDQAKRLEAVQAIPLTVEEIVLDELIYQPRKPA